MNDSTDSHMQPSAAAYTIGCAVIATSILIPVFVGFSFWPFLFSILAGLMVGGPVIAIASRLDPTKASDRSFWPTRHATIRFCWDVLVAVTFLSVPAMLFPAFWLIQAGDSWLLAMVRVLFFTFFVAATWGWMKTCGGLLEGWYRGRASDQTIQYFANAASVKQTPNDFWATFKECCGILFIAAIAFSIVFAVIDFNAKWLQLDLDGPKRFRTLAKLLMWCRGNPNSTWSTSLAIGLGALGWVFYKIAYQWHALPRR